jgi:hypothetical protein
MLAQPPGELIADFRRRTGLTRPAFWSQYGVSLSAGAGYEASHKMPRSVQILVEAALYDVAADRLYRRMKAVRLIAMSRTVPPRKPRAKRKPAVRMHFDQPTRIEQRRHGTYCPEPGRTVHLLGD